MNSPSLIVLQVPSSSFMWKMLANALRLANLAKTLQIPVEFIKTWDLFSSSWMWWRKSPLCSQPTGLSSSSGVLFPFPFTSTYIAVVFHAAGLYSNSANSYTVLNTLKQQCGRGIKTFNFSYSRFNVNFFMTFQDELLFAVAAFSSGNGQARQDLFFSCICLISI